MSCRFISYFLCVSISCLSLWGASCGGGSKNCDVVAQSGCDGGQVCEEILGGATGCFSPLVVQGMVFDLADDSAVEGARVVALDVNGSPVSSVVISDANGDYQLSVPTTRTEEGVPVGDDFTLRADAATYQTFPSGVRLALPIDTSSPTELDGQFVIDTALTDIGLLALEAGAGNAAIHGTVELPDDSAGALVIAESSPTSGFSAIADRDGNYKIFNLPDGDYTVTAYVRGVNYDPGSATVAAGDDAEVNLSINSEATATLNGSVQVVNPGEEKVTSVILVVESTFNDALIRGETPPGLRAPDPGVDPNISGSFTIDGIPSGRYVVLAAFENDLLVRDADLCISGTDVLHQEFASGETIDLSSGFKITGALDVVSPGASGPENITVPPNPTFTWKDDSSENNYEVSVVDSFGNVIWEVTIPDVSSGDVSVVFDFDNTATEQLMSGMFYQFRAISTKSSGGTCSLSQLSSTEDLKGVFFVE